MRDSGPIYGARMAPTPPRKCARVAESQERRIFPRHECVETRLSLFSERRGYITVRPVRFLKTEMKTFPNLPKEHHKSLCVCTPSHCLRVSAQIPLCHPHHLVRRIHTCTTAHSDRLTKKSMKVKRPLPPPLTSSKT